MKKLVGLGLVLCLVIIATATFVTGQLEQTTYTTATTGKEVELVSGELQQGKLAPDITLPTLDGQQQSLQQLKGKNVIVNFWATWCPPCRAEMPAMQRYYDNYAQKHNVEILAVNLTKSDRGIDHIQQFVEQYHLSFPVLLDEQEVVSKRYAAISIPTTYIIDADGRIRHTIVGPVDEKMLNEFVGAL